MRKTATEIVDLVKKHAYMATPKRLIYDCGNEARAVMELLEEEHRITDTRLRLWLQTDDFLSWKSFFYYTGNNSPLNDIDKKAYISDITEMGIINDALQAIRQHLGTKGEETHKLLPPALSTPRAEKYLKKAMERGLIKQGQNGTFVSEMPQKALLAYFCKRIYCKDDSGKDNGTPFPDRDLSQLFGMARLGKSASDLASRKNGGKPRNAKIVDDLFT